MIAEQELRIKVGQIGSDRMADRLDRIQVLAEFPTNSEISAAGGDLAAALTVKLGLIAGLAEPPNVLEVLLEILEAKGYEVSTVQEIDLDQFLNQDAAAETGINSSPDPA